MKQLQTGSRSSYFHFDSQNPPLMNWSLSYYIIACCTTAGLLSHTPPLTLVNNSFSCNDYIKSGSCHMTIIIPPPVAALDWQLPKTHVWWLHIIAWLQLSITGLDLKHLLCKIILPSTLHSSLGSGPAVWCEISLLALLFHVHCLSLTLSVSLNSLLLFRKGCVFHSLLLNRHSPDSNEIRLQLIVKGRKCSNSKRLMLKSFIIVRGTGLINCTLSGAEYNLLWSFKGIFFNV